MHNKNEYTLFLLALFGRREEFSGEVTLSLLLAIRGLFFNHNLGVVAPEISHTHMHAEKTLC